MRPALCAGLALASCLITASFSAAAAKRSGAAEAIGWFRRSGSLHVENVPGQSYARVREVDKTEYLEQLITVDGAVHRYAVDVAGTPLLGSVVGLAAAGPSRHHPDDAYPTLTPWITVRRSTPVTDVDAAARGWKARRRPVQDEVQELAVAERRGPDDVPRLMRVQRFFWMKTMGAARVIDNTGGARFIGPPQGLPTVTTTSQQVSVSLRPADAVDGRFREIRVSLNGLAAHFRLPDDLPGEIVGFRATLDQIYLTTSTLQTYRIGMEVEPAAPGEDAKSRLNLFTIDMRPIDANELVKVATQITPGACPGALTAVSTAAE